MGILQKEEANQNPHGTDWRLQAQQNQKHKARVQRGTRFCWRHRDAFHMPLCLEESSLSSLTSPGKVPTLSMFFFASLCSYILERNAMRPCRVMEPVALR